MASSLSSDGGILSSRSFSFGPSGPSTETCLAELRWRVRHVAAGIFLSCWVTERNRQQPHVLLRYLVCCL